jgi:DNA-directed RNA polymerase specialized sigma24 family protein
MTEAGGRTADVERERFEGLLGALGQDRERAGEQYEGLRRSLVAFFRWRGATAPEELADDTLDRVGRKLHESPEGGARELVPYVYGIARNVLREAQARARRTQRALDRLRGEVAEVVTTPTDLAAAIEEERGASLACLERCLDALAPEARHLVLEYYGEDKRARIEARRGLAETQGVELNTIRVRLWRIRRRLEACVRGCRQSKRAAAQDVSTAKSR